MFETPQAQAPHLQSPLTDPGVFADLSEYELRVEIGRCEQWYRSGTNAVNTLAMSNEMPPENFRRYIMLNRALRAKTRPIENWPHRGKAQA